MRQGNSSSRNGGWPAAVAFEVGAGSRLIPSHPGQSSHVLELPCSGPCRLTKEFHFSGNRLPPDAIVSKLKRSGWRTGRKLVCPSCNGHASNPVQEEEKPMVAKTSLMNGSALDSKTGAMPAPTTPSDNARAVKRSIIEWLDMSYDLEKQHYKDGFSDETVAKETGAALSHVSQMRDDLYGPANPPEPKEVRRLREDIAVVQKTIDSCMTEVEKAVSTIVRLSGRLDELTTKNSWRV